MTTKLNLLFTIWLLTLTLSHSRPTRPESSTGSYPDQLKNNKNDNGYGTESFYRSPPLKTGVASSGDGPESLYKPPPKTSVASSGDGTKSLYKSPPKTGAASPGHGNDGIIFGPMASDSDMPIPGYGSGGEYSIGGIVRPTIVCKEKGHCYNKKLTCPAKCFKSVSLSGKGYGGGGGGGGCIMDCKKKCVAYC